MSEPDFEAIEVPEWLLEAAEELDVFLAQRHHEEALQLLERVNNYFTELKNQPLDNKLLDIKQKVRVEPYFSTFTY